MEGIDRHSELSSAAAKRVNEKFLWSNTAESYLSSINKIVSTHKKVLVLRSRYLILMKKLRLISVKILL